MLRIGLAAVLVTSLGCAGLLVQPEDSGLVKTAKVTTRVLYGIPTFGFSELGFLAVKQKRAQQANWDAWVTYTEITIRTKQEELADYEAKALHASTEAERLLWLQRHSAVADELLGIRRQIEGMIQAEVARQQMAEQRRAAVASAFAYGLAQQITLPPSQPGYTDIRQTPAIQVNPIQVQPLPVPRNISCTSNIIGNTVYTNCY